MSFFEQCQSQRINNSYFCKFSPYNKPDKKTKKQHTPFVLNAWTPDKEPFFVETFSDAILAKTGNEPIRYNNIECEDFTKLDFYRQDLIFLQDEMKKLHDSFATFEASFKNIYKAYINTSVLQSSDITPATLNLIQERAEKTGLGVDVYLNLAILNLDKVFKNNKSEQDLDEAAK